MDPGLGSPRASNPVHHVRRRLSLRGHLRTSGIDPGQGRATPMANAAGAAHRRPPRNGRQTLPRSDHAPERASDRLQPALADRNRAPGHHHRSTRQEPRIELHPLVRCSRGLTPLGHPTAESRTARRQSQRARPCSSPARLAPSWTFTATRSTSPCAWAGRGLRLAPPPCKSRRQRTNGTRQPVHRTGGVRRAGGSTLRLNQR
jgi:hypothetical protein